MQTKFYDLAVEAISLNTALANKAFDYGVETSKQFGNEFTGQAEKVLGAKTVNDVIAVQTDWLEKLAGQSKAASQMMLEFGSEANASYSSLWKKYADMAMAPMAAVMPKK